MAQTRTAMPRVNGKTTAGAQRDHMTLGQRFALVVGIVFVVVGIAGFISGLNRNFDDLSFAGHGSHAELLGTFQVSVLHNVVHLLFGIAGLVASRTARWSRMFLLAAGAIYLVLALYGFVIDHNSDANFVPVNRADDWLHVALGVGMVGLGLVAKKDDEHALDRR